MHEQPIPSQDAPRRSPRRDAVRERRAVRAVAPVSRRVNGWQLRAARLIAAAEYADVHRHDGGRYLAELESLSAEVREGREWLDEQLTSLPPNLVEHSRIRDAVRAFDSLAKAIARARGLLDGDGADRAGGGR
jgi:hypothetical protein